MCTVRDKVYSWNQKVHQSSSKKTKRSLEFGNKVRSKLVGPIELKKPSAPVKLENNVVCIQGGKQSAEQESKLIGIQNAEQAKNGKTMTN